MKFPCLIWCLLVAVTWNAAAAPKEEPPPPPPPMAQPQILSIYRGRTIEIPLHAIGRASKPLKFLIRNRPKYGRLGTIVPTGNKTAIVTYTHDADSGTSADSFSFAVQGQGTPVSAPAQIQIAVSEEPPAFSVVHSLDFGRVLLGEPKEEEITIRNSGGGTLAGTIIAPAPWRVLGTPKYKLARNQEQKVRLIFAPSEAREYTEKLVFSHDARSPVTLTGIATSPFELTPSGEIQVTRQDSGTVRSGGLIIHNVTTRERTIEVTVPKNISAPDQVIAGPDGEARIAFHTTPDFLGEIEGTVVIESEGYRQNIPLRAPAFPPILEFEPKSGLDFSDTSVAEPKKLKVTLKNVGGVSARLKVLTPPDLQIVPEPNNTFLEPAKALSFEAIFETRTEGIYRGDVEIQADGATSVIIPVTAKISNPVNSAPEIAPVLMTTTGTSTTTDNAGPPGFIVDEKEPFSEDIPVVDSIQIATLPNRNIELSWKKPAPNAVTPMIEQRMIESTGSDTPPKVTWRRLENIKFSERDGIVVARIENPARGQTWFMRISSINELGRRSAPSPTIQLSTPPAEKSALAVLAVAIVLVTAAGYAGYKIYQHRQAIDAERLSRIESGN